MHIERFIKKNIYLIGAIFVFLLFYKISTKTPLAGDDWGYAINGTENNPLLMAVEFYKTWSGRFFSELYGFLVAPNKEIWNILNPTLFLGIYVCLYCLSNNDKNYCLTILLIIFSIMTVENNIRMETYSWVMGTTYIIPLFLSLFYFLIIDKILSCHKTNKFISAVMYSLNVLVFIIGLAMENIAATMIVGIFILLIYSYKKNKKLSIYFLINLIVAIISFLIMRLSPGSFYRLMRDNYEWASLNIFNKMIYGYPSFVDKTFINHKYTIFLFSLSILFIAVYSNKIKIKIKIIITVIQCVAIFTVFSKAIWQDSFLLDPSSLYSMIFWPLYAAINFMCLLFLVDDKKLRYKVVFFYIMAGIASLVMLMSPLYGFRSSVYTIYFMIIVYTLILNEYLNNNLLNLAMCACMMLIIYNKHEYYNYIYDMVENQSKQRDIVLNYYRDHPEDPEVWIERYPLNTIHGADIDPGDTYHFEVFKEYYDIPQNADKIFFYVTE